MKDIKYPKWYEKRENVFEELQPDFFVGRESVLNCYWYDLLFNNQVFLSNMALISQRKMGKTALLKRFCNVLFSDQRKVVPFFYGFPQEEIREKLLIDDVAEDMMLTFVKQFMAFYYKKSDLFLVGKRGRLLREIKKIDHPLCQFIIEEFDYYDEDVQKAKGHNKIQVVFDSIVEIVKRAGLRCMMVIDEVQEMDLCIYDKEDKLLHCTSALTRIYQTPTVWLAVTGSKVSCICNKVIVDAMRNRISLRNFFPLEEKETGFFVDNLVKHLGQEGYVGIREDVFHLTGGNPYYIQQLFHPSEYYKKAKGKDKSFNSQENLLEAFNFEVRDKKGTIYDYWNIHFERNIENLNCDGDKPGITAKILYFIAEKSRELENREPYLTKIGNVTVTNREVEIDFEEIVEELAIDMALVIEKIKQLENADFISANIKATRAGMITDRILPIFLLDQYYKKIFPNVTKQEAEQKIVEIIERVGKLEKRQEETEKRQKKSEKRQSIAQKERKETEEKIGKKLFALRGDVNNLKGKQGQEIVCEAIKYGIGIFAPYKGQDCIEALIPDDKKEKHNIDIFVHGHKANGTKALLPLAIEVKNEKSKVYIGQANHFVACVRTLKRKYNISKLKAYFVCLQGASKSAARVLEENGIDLITFREICPSYQVD